MAKRIPRGSVETRIVVLQVSIDKLNGLNSNNYHLHCQISKTLLKTLPGFSQFKNWTVYKTSSRRSNKVHVPERIKDLLITRVPDS